MVIDVEDGHLPGKVNRRLDVDPLLTGRVEGDGGIPGSIGRPVGLPWCIRGQAEHELKPVGDTVFGNSADRLDALIAQRRGQTERGADGVGVGRDVGDDEGPFDAAEYVEKFPGWGFAGHLPIHSMVPLLTQTECRKPVGYTRRI